MNRSTAADLPKSRTPEERKERVEMASKQKSVYNNPCIKEQEQSYKCLAKHNYDKTACEVVFVNYILCQKFWQKVKNDRKVRRISPQLPLPDDRDRIKEEYLKKWNLK